MSATGLYPTLEQFLADITGQDKTAAALSEPGGHKGPTTHPSKDVDDGLQASSEGSHSKANESAVKEQIGAPSVNSATENATDQDSQQLNIGTTQTSTGNDPAVEDKYRDRMPDPGGHQGATTHPAVVGVDKYGSMDFHKLASHVSQVGNEILANIIRGPESIKTATAPASEPAAAPAAPASTPAPEVPDEGTAKAAAAAEAGYNLAAILGLEGMTEQERALQTIAATIKTAAADGDLLVEYLTAAKTAMDDEASASEDHDKPGDDGTGGAPPAEAGGEGGGAATDLAAMLGGGGGDPAAAGGVPTGDVGGGAALAGMMGDPAAAGGDAGGMGNEASLAALASALMELGIDPQALAAAAGPVGAKLASAVTKFKRSGKFSIKEAATPAEVELRTRMKNHLREIMGDN